MKYQLLLIIGLLVTFSACDPDTPNPNKTTTVNFNLKAQIDGDPFVVGDFYDYEQGDKIQLSTLNFYISEVTLLGGSEEVQVLDIGEIDLYDNHKDLAGAMQGENMVFEKVPTGTYTGVRFGIGVAANLNQTNPGDYENGHPLSNTGNYWSWRETYIFAKFEGQLDTAGNSQVNDVFFTYHPGEDAFYRTITLTKDFTLEKKEEATIQLFLDIKKIFETENGYLDIVGSNQSHTGPDDSWIVELIMDNMVEAITISD